MLAVTIPRSLMTEKSLAPSDRQDQEGKRPALHARLWISDLLRLAWAFNVVALESFGGGLGAWIRRLVVVEKRWLSEEDYVSAATLCQVLPGANQLNMAVFVGARRAGLAGAIAAVVGLILVPSLLVMSLDGALDWLRSTAPVKDVLAGMASASSGLALSIAARQVRELIHTPVPIAMTASTMLLVALHMPLWATLPLCGLPGCWWMWRGTRP